MTASTFAAAQLLKIVPRVRLSRAVGLLCEQNIPAPLSELATRIYSKAYQVNLDEAEPRSEPYRSFDDFFTRRLKTGARSIEDARVVSPSDGKIASVGALTKDGTIFAKGQAYEVGELIGSGDDAERYYGGQFAVIYLSPRDYHRVHSPVDGKVVEIRSMPGDLYPVNGIGERYVPGLFVRNKRVAIVIDSAELGRVTAVMVGATIVGRISVAALPFPSVPVGVHPLSSPTVVARGDEIGTFHLGSTVVVLLEKPVTLSRATGPVLYGESLERS